VLLSLIEATELASADARSKFNNASDSPPVNGKKTHQENVPSEDVSPPQQTLLSMGSMIDAEDEEEEKIKMSTSLAIGVAGTYAVAAKEGLDIYPSRPSSDKEDEDVDTLVRFFHLDQNSPGKKKRMGSKKGSPLKGSPLKGSPLKGSPGDKLQTGLLKLSFGDRVQIVSFDGGWAKLARGYGFVRAGKNELVKGRYFAWWCSPGRKGTLALFRTIRRYSFFLFSGLTTVGGPVDRACKLEAMLCTLSNRRKELRHEQTKIDNQFIRFMNDLQVSLQSDEDLTVIVADAFAASDSNIVRELAYVEKEEKKTSLEEERNDYASIQKPAQLERQITPPSQGSNISGMPRFACFAGSVFGDSDDSSRERRATQSLRSVLTHPERSPSANDDATSPRDASAMFSSSTNTSPSAMRAGAQAWRDQHGINFKSGLSGHMGLLSTHAHAHGYLEPTRRSTRTTAFPHMSSHTGLTVPKAPSMQNILSSLTLPVIGTPPRQQSPRQQIQQSGSM
jgi:hypothetical protein